MRVVGVIAEYNPFHLGHAHQLAEAKRLSGADCVVVVMSGCFTQRGTPALLSPTDRARMALRCGADAVFLLPSFWAVRDAEHFALGGVALLAGLGCDAISFGTETDDLILLQAAARLLEHPDEVLSSEIHSGLAAGLPHPSALSAAVARRSPAISALLENPNNTLAVCYLRAMMQIGAPMEVFPVQRIGGYHNAALNDKLPSATALRGAIIRGDWQSAYAAIPPEGHDVLRRAALNGALHRPEALDAALLYRLRTMSAHEAAQLPDISEGIEYRLKNSASQSSTREELLQNAKTRRYPYARLSRLATHALLGISDDMLAATPLPEAAWLLGFREEARGLFGHFKQKGSLPIIGKAADYKENTAWFETEMRAYDLWALGAGLPSGLAKTQGIVKE